MRAIIKFFGCGFLLSGSLGFSAAVLAGGPSVLLLPAMACGLWSVIISNSDEE